MKICFLTHNLIQDNGIGIFSKRLIDGVKQFYDVDVLTTQEGILQGKDNLLKNFFRIRRIFKEADIIHALDLFPYGFIAVFFSLGLRKKIIITTVGSGSIIPLYNRYYFLSRYCYHQADLVTAISNFTKKEILKRAKRTKIKTITPGVDFEKFNKNIDGSYVKRLNLPQNYILSVGALRWRKGYGLSIRAFAKACNVFPDLHYVIAGKKYTEKQFNVLKDLVKKLDLTERVHIFDNITTLNNFDELLCTYKNAKLFVLMSQNTGHDIEGFGMVFLEAAACGLPVVGSKDCGVEDAVRSGRNGFLVGERDIDGCAEAVIKILSDKNLRHSMSEESLKFVKEQSWQSKIEQYKKIYQEVLLA